MLKIKKQTLINKLQDSRRFTVNKINELEKEYREDLERYNSKNSFIKLFISKPDLHDWKYRKGVRYSKLSWNLIYIDELIAKINLQDCLEGDCMDIDEDSAYFKYISL